MTISPTQIDLYSKFEQELEKLEEALDECFEVVNMITLWRVMNGIKEGDNEFETLIAERLSNSFGEEVGTTLRSVLFGA